MAEALCHLNMVLLQPSKDRGLEHVRSRPTPKGGNKRDKPTQGGVRDAVQAPGSRPSPWSPWPWGPRAPRGTCSLASFALPTPNFRINNPPLSGVPRVYLGYVLYQPPQSAG